MQKTCHPAGGAAAELGEDGIRRTLKRLRCSNALIEEAAVLVREARSVTVAFSSDTSTDCGTSGCFVL